jgi:hypothetical protein
MSMKRLYSRLWTWVWLALWIGVLVGVWQWRWVRDQYVLRTYTPSVEIQNLLVGIDLTPAGRAALYRSQPELDDKTSFQKHCPTESSGLELGCYDAGRIYILRIDNADLAVEMKAVLVHEMLHAVWADLSSRDRQAITSEVEAYYRQYGSSDKDLAERMVGYAETEPGESANELHSILGSERLDLPVGLEQHYRRYMSNRVAVAEFHQLYAAVFQKRLALLEQELADIQSGKLALDVLNSRMASLRRSSKIAEYNALVPQQNSMVVAINTRIEHYRQAVAEYNALSVALDAQAAPSPVIPVQ